MMLWKNPLFLIFEATHLLDMVHSQVVFVTDEQQLRP